MEYNKNMNEFYIMLVQCTASVLDGFSEALHVCYTDGEVVFCKMFVQCVSWVGGGGGGE